MLQTKQPQSSSNKVKEVI